MTLSTSSDDDLDHLFAEEEGQEQEQVQEQDINDYSRDNIKNDSQDTITTSTSASNNSPDIHHQDIQTLPPSQSFNSYKKINLQRVYKPPNGENTFLIKIPGFISIDNSSNNNSNTSNNNSPQKEAHHYEPTKSHINLEKKPLYAIKCKKNDTKVMTNTRIIQWSDGSYSLLIVGQNNNDIQFDLHVTNNPSPHDYLYAKHSEQEEKEEGRERGEARRGEGGLLEFTTKISKKMNILPFDSHSVIMGSKRYLSSKEHEPMALKLALTTEHHPKVIKHEPVKREKKKAAVNAFSSSSFDSKKKTAEAKRKRYKDEELEEDYEEDEYDRDFIDDDEMVDDDDEMVDDDDEYVDNDKDYDKDSDDNDNDNSPSGNDRQWSSTSRKSRKNIARIFDDD